ncbi:toxin VasX [Proteus columbae]|uniref:toxin VasX n=1 Tax=Proteus columbae TaxID=1987580 RepID=UPI00288B8839|nr:toxin VasX [Proteus columbae]
MSSSSKKEGCKFCTRYGFPILPVRPAIMSQNDILPVIPNTIDVPINNQGETAYTLRLLRAGYLNIWDELGQSWINYYVTKDGFYYPLPENGEAPDDILSGEVTPCINKPEELARASFITLPIFPAPLKNGNFWFSWSEVKWTDTVRKNMKSQVFIKKICNYLI